MTEGGGIDFNGSKLVSVRPIEAEYFMTKIPDGLNHRQDNLRIGARIVVRSGGNSLRRLRLRAPTGCGTQLLVAVSVWGDEDCTHNHSQRSQRTQSRLLRVQVQDLCYVVFGTRIAPSRQAPDPISFLYNNYGTKKAAKGPSGVAQSASIHFGNCGQILRSERFRWRARSV
jgi:hypothetical protein